jgi:hypothetical protein
MIEYQQGEKQMAMLGVYQNQQEKASTRFEPERQKGPVIDCRPQIPSSKICLLKSNLGDKRVIIHQ